MVRSKNRRYMNWGRWNNNRGLLNLISPEKVIEATGLVTSGKVITCSKELNPHDTLRSTPAFVHRMLYTKTKTADGIEFGGGIAHAASDEIQIRIHGLMNTHIDAFCHVGVDGKGFNDIDWDEMVTTEGGQQCSITDALSVLTRGVLVDIPRLRGTTYAEPGEAISADELGSYLNEVKQGDALIIRTGRWNIPDKLVFNYAKDPHGNFPGLHPDCGRLLYEHKISVLGMDSGCDVFPALPEYIDNTIHIQCLTYYGIHLVHNMDLEALAEECAKSGRMTFLFIVNSLNIPKGTGSPVTPIAVM